MRYTSSLCLIVTSLSSLSLVVGEDSAIISEFDDASIEFFEREVRPILAKRCFECHSKDSEEPGGGLRLDSRLAIVAGGETGPAIEPGKPNDSLLIDAVNYGEIYEMPPKSKMPASEIAVLAKWVSIGAPWPKEDPEVATNLKTFDLEARKASHWCWQPVRDPKLPSVQQRGWPSKPLDHFILAKLEAVGLTPAGRADKRTLIRRAYFDITGLPPTSKQVDAFLADESPQAFEHVIDDLLDSPHFGERWARHWMDLMRYAETYGHEFDYPIPHAYKYRDYLIRAFNADIPYDRFVSEHIAGDLIMPRLHPTGGCNESVIATASWWLGEATHAPVDVTGDEAGRIDNQIDVMTKAFLGLTVACARCHDHKFDAISTKDYYALTGFLQSSRRAEVINLTHEAKEVVAQARWIKHEGSQEYAKALPDAPIAGKQFANYLLATRDVMFGDQGTDLAVAARKFSVDLERLTKWVEAFQSDEVKLRSHPLYVWSVVAESPTEQTLERLRNQIAADEKRRGTLEETHPLFSDFTRLEPGQREWFIEGQAFPTYVPLTGEWEPGRGIASWTRHGIANSSRLGLRQQGAMRSKTFELKHRNIYYRAKGKDAKIRLVVDGYFMDVYNGLLFSEFSFDVKDDSKFSWHRQSGDLGRYLGHKAYIEILDHGDGYAALDEVRFSDEGVPPELLSPLAARLVTPDMKRLEDLARQYASLWDATCRELAKVQEEGWRSSKVSEDWMPQQAELLDWCGSAGLLPNVGEAVLRTYERDWQPMVKQMPSTNRVLGMLDGTGEDSPIFVRGNHKAAGPIVPRRMLEALGGKQVVPIDAQFTHPPLSGRHLLAQQVVDPANPLTARVMVNRLWHHMTGRGIVASTDNFGVLGQKPTHPDLLDHLATEFVREGWSIKRMLKQIMLSSTYQMSSKPSDVGSDRDPQNFLLHRARIRRLQGEAIRDSILAISGRLDQTMFGPSVPVHVTSFMQGRGRPGNSGPLDGNGRRSLYIEVRRNFLSPMMLAFDMPIPFSAVGRRNASNVPAQALIMMNDPFVVEQAHLWAKRLLANDGTTEERIHDMYIAAFARPPNDSEVSEATTFLMQQGEAIGLTGEQAVSDEQTWVDLCHVMMNVKEFVFVN